MQAMHVSVLVQEQRERVSTHMQGRASACTSNGSDSCCAPNWLGFTIFGSVLQVVLAPAWDSLSSMVCHGLERRVPFVPLSVSEVLGGWRGYLSRCLGDGDGCIFWPCGRPRM